MYNKHRIRTIAALIVGVCASVVAGVAVLALASRPNTAPNPPSADTPKNSTTAILIPYEELKQPYTTCAGFGVETGKSVLILKVNGRSYALDSQRFIDGTGQPIPQLHQTGSYEYYGQNPCNAVDTTAHQQSQAVAQKNSDRNMILTMLAALIPLAVVAFAIVFNKPKPGVTQSGTYQGYRMRLNGKNEIAAPFSSVNISISESGDLVFTGTQNETINNRAIQRILISSFGMSVGEPLLQVELNDGSVIFINHGGAEVVKGAIKAHHRYLLFGLLSRYVALAATAKQMQSGAQTQENFILPLLYELQLKLGKDRVKSLSTLEEKLVKVLLGAWLVYVAATAVLLVLYHRTSGTVTDTDLMAILGIIFILLLFVGFLIYEVRNYAKESRFQNLIK